MAWTTAKCLIIGAFIALAVAVWLAITPVQNPGVQDCGAPIGFVVFSRSDLKVLPPDAPNPGELILQPTCRERVDGQLLRATVAFGAFLGLGMLGAVIGLIDDRWEYHKAPRFESLLRERPVNAPGRMRAPPVVQQDELGVALPQVEGPDVVLLVVFSVATVAGLVAFAGYTEVMDALGTAATGGLLGLGVLTVGTFVIAGAQLMLAQPDAATAAASGEDEDTIGPGRALELSVASAAAQPLLPGLGPLGLDAHALCVGGGPRDVSLRRLDARQAFGVGAHILVLLVVLVTAGLTTLPPVTMPAGWIALAGATGLLCAVGVFRAPNRLRRLVITPSPRAVREVFSASPGRAVGQFGGALALTIANSAAFLLAVTAVATIEGGLPTTVTVGRIALVYLLGCVVAALSPTPAGLGAFEAFAVLGLVLCGALPSTAVAGVLVFRIATVWIPILIGLVPFGRLLRREVI